MHRQVGALGSFLLTNFPAYLPKHLATVKSKHALLVQIQKETSESLAFALELSFFFLPRSVNLGKTGH